MVLEGRGPLDLLKENLVLSIGVTIPVCREVARLVTMARLPISERRMDLICRSACERATNIGKTEDVPLCPQGPTSPGGSHAQYDLEGRT